VKRVRRARAVSFSLSSGKGATPMSRIGKAPVAVPNGVTVTLKDDNVISVKGPKGELTRSLPAAMTVAQENGQVTVTRPSDEDQHKALHGLTRTLIANMVEGVTKGFSKNLELVGVGYKAEVRPYGLQLALGYSHPIEYRAPQGIKLTAPVPTQIVVEGANKEVVGQVAAEIRSLRPPEPYKGKGVKYAGEQIRRKAGKAGGK
jgi:large subunit ribosomal protein L6